MNRRLLALLFFGLVGCSSGGGLVEAEPRLTAPSQLDFGEILVDTRSTRALVLRNDGAGSTSVRVTVTPPFTVETQELTVAGQTTRHLGISVTPQKTESLEGTAVLEWKKGTIEVRLTAKVVEPRLCDPSDECRTIEFQPGKGCVEAWAPDGTPCERACLEEASCLKGRCVGREKVCDDGNECTRDVCDPVAGCRHIPDPDAACGDPTNPCVVASCDEVEGKCRLDPVIDGTPCGEATCGVSLVCIGGSCQEKKTPEGGACGTETPCRPRGTCVEGECIQPSAHPLPLLWSHQARDGWDLRFEAVTGPLGRMYWVECGGHACDLVTAVPPTEGAIRSSLFAEGVVSPRGRLLLSGGRLVSTHRRGWIQIRSALDLGSVVSLDLAQLLAEGEEEWAADEWEAVELAAHQDLGFALVEARNGGAPVQGWAIAFRLADGGIEWSRRMEGIFDGLVVDELGRLYFSWMHRDPDFGPPALVSMSPSGGERWRVAVDHTAPVAVASGRLLDGGANVRRLEDGAVEDALEAILPLSARSAVLDIDRGVFLGYPLVRCGPGEELCPLWIPHLLGFEPWSREGLQWMAPVEAAEVWERTEPFLTDEGSLLFVQPVRDPFDPEPPAGCKQKYFLEEFRLGDEGAGRPEKGYSCQLPGAGYEGAAGLSGGILAVFNSCENQIEVFELEDHRLAERGWVTAGGGPGRAGRPR